MDNLSAEIFRKVIHAGGGVCILLLVNAGILTTGILGLFVVLIGALVLFNFNVEKELLTRILSINRADKNIPGIDLLSFFLGCWLVLVLFEQHIAFASIMILSFADPVAHFAGGGIGGRASATRNSYLWGGVGGTIAGTIAATVYVPFLPALLASGIAMLVEAGELRIINHHIDDNLTIPVIAGCVLWVTRYAITY